MLRSSADPWLAKRKFKLVDLPRFFSLEEYQDTVSKVVAHLSRFPEVVAIHQIGGVSTPGISDIDLIVVFRDGNRRSRAHYAGILDQRDRYRLKHSLFGISASLYSKKDLLPPIFATQLLHGVNKHDASVLNPIELSAIREIYAVEYVLANIFNLYQQVYDGRLKVRGLLCSFKALAQDLDLLSNQETRSEVGQFEERVARLRANWWSDPNGTRQEMLEIPAEITCLAQKVIVHFATLLHDTGGKSRLPGHIVCGPNFYIAAGKEDDDFHVDILQSSISRFLCMDEGERKTKRFKPLAGVERALWALRVNVPSKLFGLLQGKGGGPYTSSYERRMSFLKEYESFMRLIPHEYGMFDTLRWRPSANYKWRFISGLNRLFWSQGCS